MTDPAVCPNGHAIDDGYHLCPTCGAYRPSAAQADDYDAYMFELDRVEAERRRYEYDVEPLGD
jgi:hypothetical protein